jgi:hypothetical protein
VKRRAGIVSAAVAIVALLGGTAASRADVPSSSPAPLPWLQQVKATRFTSANGDGVTVGSLLWSQEAASAPPRLSIDSRRGLIQVCGEPVSGVEGRTDCGFVIYLRAVDVPAPPDAASASIEGTRIGLTYEQLLAQLHADTLLNEGLLTGKQILKGPRGSVLRVNAYYVGRRVDHGWQGGNLLWIYVLKDGIVVAAERYGSFG